MKSTTLPRRLGLLMAGIAVAAATPALAQIYDDSDNGAITVTGRYGTVPDSVQSLSLRVSYADLDLGTPYGRDALRDRIGYTADFLCGKLGESDDNLGVIPSCQTAAFDDGMRQANYVIDHYFSPPEHTAWYSHARLHEPRYSARRDGYPACTATRRDDCVEVGRW